MYNGVGLYRINLSFYNKTQSQMSLFLNGRNVDAPLQSSINSR